MIFKVGENKIKMTLDFMMVNTEYKVIKTMANGKINNYLKCQ
jgi:hypothetical protein